MYDKRRFKSLIDGYAEERNALFNEFEADRVGMFQRYRLARTRLISQFCEDHERLERNHSDPEYPLEYGFLPHLNELLADIKNTHFSLSLAEFESQRVEIDSEFARRLALVCKVYGDERTALDADYQAKRTRAFQDFQERLSAL